MKVKLYHVDKPVSTVYDTIDLYTQKNYVLVFNEVSCDFDIKLKGQRLFKKLNIDSLSITLERNGINFTDKKLEKYLKSDYISKINPMKDYFSRLPVWNQKTDYINNLIKHIPVTETELFEYHFKKWLVRTIKCATNDNEINKQAIIFVQPEQNTGKTTFIRYLCPPELKEYFSENIGFDKDARIKLCNNFIINLEELEETPKNHMSLLKAFFSQLYVNERLPYEKKNSLISRKASFIGSTNIFDFLNDSTGSVRWICFELKGLFDFNYTKINIDNIWSQAYFLSKDPSYNSNITREDQVINEERNKQFTVQNPEEVLIQRLFEEGEAKEHFLTSTDVTEILKRNSTFYFHPVPVGKALRKLDFKAIKKNGVNGYYIQQIKV